MNLSNFWFLYWSYNKHPDHSAGDDLLFHFFYCRQINDEHESVCITFPTTWAHGCKTRHILPYTTNDKMWLGSRQKYMAVYHYSPSIYACTHTAYCVLCAFRNELLVFSFAMDSLIHKVIMYVEILLAIRVLYLDELRWTFKLNTFVQFQWHPCIFGYGHTVRRHGQLYINIRHFLYIFFFIYSIIPMEVEKWREKIELFDAFRCI